MSRDEPDRLGYPLGQTATAATLPETSDSVASSRGLFPYLTSVPVAQGGRYPRREDMNALIKELGAYAYFQQCGHVWSYDSDLMASGYGAGDMVYYDVAGDLYIEYTPSGSSSSELIPVAYASAQEDLQAGAPYIFIRNSTAYTSGAGAPVAYDSTEGVYVLNSAYWTLVLTDQQYATLLKAISQASGAEYPDNDYVISMLDTELPYVFVTFEGADEDDPIYVYAVDTSGNVLTDALPGNQLISVGGGKWLFTWAGNQCGNINTANYYSVATVLFTCGDSATADIARSDIMLNGDTVQVSAGSSVVIITS